jgi:hypothetical protein
MGFPTPVDQKFTCSRHESITCVARIVYERNVTWVPCRDRRNHAEREPRNPVGAKGMRVDQVEGGLSIDGLDDEKAPRRSVRSGPRGRAAAPPTGSRCHVEVEVVAEPHAHVATVAVGV